MKCIECSVADVKTALEVHPKMARHGFAKCPTDPDPYRFASLHFERDCGRFSPAAPESAEKRIRILSRTTTTKEE